MAESVTIARPYAQAVFRLARESKALAAWSGRLQRLAAIAQDAEMTKVVGNPKFSAGQVANLFVSLSGEAGNKELVSFIGMLAENERLGVLMQIQEIYEQLKSADEGVKEAVVTSAFPLDNAQLKNLMSQLETHFGSKLQPRVEVDEALIGGVKVAVGDQVLDASVRGKLEAMATALKN
ncbi:MAG: F0F1 ATP synthase subunit delta [Propionivibrio sp.]|uniref:F0F1 ATP synthase subunit delta n=1 Tax=Propionivibrio sp. TaxID=2212460 RepID=UPI0025DD5648|nr:F0F1 ATP synthase subunit delta [Propionivibrio sp.]MBL0207505.1 F0F1 ATP synthase subunit delta [Propionivibrio sp.]